MKQQSKAVNYLIRGLKSIIIPVGVWVVFAILSGGRTATWSMTQTTLRQSVIASIICYGIILNMTVGMMNFSAGGMMLFAGIVGGNLAKMTGMGIPGLLLFCLLICIAEGIVTGLLYNVMRVPCIVLTIGMMLIWESFPKVIFEDGVNLRASMTILARSPNCFIILAIAFVIFYIMYNKTAFGHNLRAIGSNQAIANSVGLDSDKIKLASFIIGSFFLGIAATLYVSNSGEVRNVTSMGSMTIMMDGFMGMFIAMFLSRYCNLSIAVIFGTFSMQMLSNGFVALGLSSTIRDIVQGIFLLVLLIISSNAGVFERKKADKLFAQECNEEYAKAQAKV